MFLKSLAITLALTLLLAGCGAASTSANPSSSSAAPAASQAAPAVGDLGVGIDALVTALDAVNSTGSYPLLSKASKAEATIETLNEGSFLCTRYTLATGLTVYFFTDMDRKALRQFSWVCDERKLAEADIPMRDAMAASLAALFEPTEADKLAAALNLASTEASVKSQTTLSGRDYYYRKYGGVLNFSVLPTGTNQLSWIGNAFTEVL